MSALTVTSITGTTSIPQGNSEVVYIVDASSGGFTITLPDAVGDDGDHMYMKRIDGVVANPVTVATIGSGQKIDGSSTVSLTKNKFYHFLAYNGQWYIIG